MNRIKATLKNIAHNESVHIVEFSFDGERLYMMALELPERLRIGQSVTLGIKSTHVSLAMDFDIATSFDNQLKASVVGIDIGEMLVNVKAAIGGVILEAVITYKSYLRMNFQVGDSIIMLLPASELSLV